MDTLSIGFMLYFQAGLILLGYLFFQRIRALRVQVLTLEADLEAAVRNLEVRLNTTASRAQASGASTTLPNIERPQARRETKREIVLELAKSGADTAGIAERLKMQPAEVDLLLKASRYRRSYAPNEAADRAPNPRILDLPGVTPEAAG